MKWILMHQADAKYCNINRLSCVSGQPLRSAPPRSAPLLSLKRPLNSFNTGFVSASTCATHRAVYLHHLQSATHLTPAQSAPKQRFKKPNNGARQNPTNPTFLLSNPHTIFKTTNFLKGTDLWDTTTDHSSSSSIGECIGVVKNAWITN